MTRVIFLSIAAGMISGNYFWQAITDQNWSLAAERSWFQCAALVAAWVAIVITSSLGLK
jgi:hypothetical protein